MSVVLYQAFLAVLDIVQPMFNFYTGFGFILTLLCGLLITPAATPVIVPKYKDLDKHKKAYLDTLFGSTIHAVILAVVTTYLLLFDKFGEEYIFSQSAVGRALLRFSLGYFCADAILIMLDSKMRGDTLSVIHHALGVFGIWLGVYYDGSAMYWVVYRFISESSTPFVNALHWMNAIGYPKRSPVFIANSLLLVAVFYSCRILLIPYHWYGLYYFVYLDPSVTIIWPIIIQYWVVITFILFDALNVIWAYKLTKGGCRVVKQLWKTD